MGKKNIIFRNYKVMETIKAIIPSPIVNYLYESVSNKSKALQALLKISYSGELV